MKIVLVISVLVLTAEQSTAATTSRRWAHVGNTYNSAIFVDLAVRSESGAKRRFRTLHVNVQRSAGWTAAEHHGAIDCVARTLRYDGVVITETNGVRKTLPSAVAKPVAFPSRGVIRTFATSVCAGKLGPPISDPQAWTKKNYRPD
jgi:hypothetical protein